MPPESSKVRRVNAAYRPLSLPPNEGTPHLSKLVCRRCPAIPRLEQFPFQQNWENTLILNFIMMRRPYPEKT
jgi:hypothetical protein